MSKGIDKLENLTAEQKKQLLQKLKAKKNIHLFPLSYAQQRMWFLNRLTPGSPVYNLPFILKIHGKLDHGAFERALKTIIRRHEILRTTFKEIKGEVRQVVGPVSAIQIEYPKLDGQPIKDFIHSRTMRPFDPEKGPLGVISLVQTTPEKHIMIMVMHHIISDGWSMGVLVREFTIIYDALLHGTEHRLPKLKVQYADYAQWQKKWLKGERLQQQLNYWRNTLTSNPPVLELNGDKPRPNELSNRGGQIYRTLQSETWQALKVRAGQFELTEFMLLLGAFYLLLNRYTRQDDICIGTPVANRNRAETEVLIGFFVNTLVMRCSFSVDDTIESFFKKVKETALGAFTHQDIPFEMLVQELQPARDMARSPLFQAFFTHTQVSGALPALDGLEFEPLTFEVSTSKFEISLFTHATEDGLNITFEYNSDLFSAPFIERLADHFVLLMQQLAQPGIYKISEIDLLPDAEKQRILHVWNNTAKSYPEPRPLLALFEAQAKLTPDRPALKFENREMTYGQLNSAADRLAITLQNQNVGPEQFVGLYLERSLELVVAMYAILKTGAAYVALDPDYPEDRIRYMINDSAAEVIITQESLKDIPALAGKTIILADNPKNPQGAQLKAVDKNVDQSAYMIYTSGSTGKPKGVVISHRAIWNRLQWMQETFQLADGEPVLQKTPYSFDVSVWEFFWPLQNGASLVLAKPGGHKDPAYLQKLIIKERITTIHFVPSMLQAFVNNADLADCTSLKRVICSGEALSPELVRQLHENSSAELHNLYGPTEAAVDVSHWPCNREENYSSIPIGYPIANTQLYIVDDQIKLLPVAVAGELLIAGVQLARNYHRRPALTAEKFIPDPFSKIPGARLYRTGDLARYMDNGAIEFLGRIDHQVKLRGLRIELGEIENALKAIDTISDAVVLVKDFGAADQRLIAYVQSAHEIIGADLQKALSLILPEYMVPSLFVKVDAIPLSPSGKTDRRALLALNVQFDSKNAYVPPRGEIEKSIARIFSEILLIDKIGSEDSFFDLGGHSLLATRLITLINKRFEINFPLRALFNAPTVKGVAKQIQQLDKHNIRSLPKADRSKPLPLSYAQQRLWFLEQLEPGSPFYNIPMAFYLHGEVDVPVLEKSFNWLIDRHEALRTSIHTIDGQGLQKIHTSVEFKLEIRDIQSHTEDIQQKEIKRQLYKMARHSFDLAKAPLFKIVLIRISKTKYLLLGVIHHIISDNWSGQLIMSELNQSYGSFLHNSTPAVANIERHYVDFAVWQREWLEQGAMAEQLAYWRSALTGIPPLLDLPTDYQRPAAQTYNGAVHRIKIELDLAEQLKSFGREHNVTSFMQFISLFGILLARLSGQNDVPIGTPVANRSLPETQKMIGFFVNTLVLRIHAGAKDNLEDILARTRQVALDAYEHQDIPFERLVDELHQNRDMAHSPLFQVMFVYNDHTPTENTGSAHWRTEPLDQHSGTAKFDLTLFINEQVDGFEALFEYNSDLFDEATIQRWSRYFFRLLKESTRMDSVPVWMIDLLDENDRQLLFTTWQTPTSPYDPNELFLDRLNQISNTFSDNTAVIMGTKSLSYSELDKRSNQLARRLIQSGIQAEERIALALPRSMDQILCLLAILKSGAAYVPIDLSYPVQRVKFMLKDAQVAMVICLEKDADLLRETKANVVFMESLNKDALQLSETPVNVHIVADQLAYMIYTSGSTGRPKGTLLTHQGLMHYLRWCLKSYPLTAGAGSIVHSTIAFDATVTSVFAPLAAGVALTLIPEDNDLQSLANVLTQNKHPYSIIKITPAHLDMLRQQVSAEQAAILARAFVIGGENLTRDQIQFWQENTPNTLLFNEYGPTETVVGCVVYEASAYPQIGSVPIGKPISNTPVYVLDSNLSPVLPGIAGELYIGGVALARGYHNRADITAERFLPDPFTQIPGARMYKSGDKVRYLNSGDLIFLGRMDHQVKIRGYRIELGEIESVLNQFPGMDSVVVVAKGSPPRLLAYFTNKEKTNPVIKDIREFLQHSLPDYMIPADFIALDALPLTSNGKIDTSALPAPSGTRGTMSTEYTAPKSEVEIILTKIFAGLLKKEKVGIHDNFFELGGDSIMSIQVISRAREQGLFITPLQMFQNQTIAQLALVAQKRKKIVAEQGLLNGDVPLTPIQHFFFEQRFNNPHHWNQSVLFKIRQKLDPHCLEQTLRALLEHHDALRLRFKHNENNTAYFSTHISSDETLEITQLSASTAEEIKEEIENHCLRMQKSLNLSEGPILKVALFQSDDYDHLAIIIHHLAMDGVSWRILLNDFQQAYTLAAASKDIVLSAKSSSYREWALALINFAKNEALKDLGFWQKMARSISDALPIDFPDGSNLEKDKADLSCLLDKEHTTLLLTDAHKAYHTEINDLLLTALMRGYGKWSGRRQLLLHVEGHGREHIDDSIDTSHTIGWFTALYPLMLHLGRAIEAGDQIKEIKEQFHAVPHNGLSYGVLRYLNPDENISSTLKPLDKINVIFNYLGQFDGNDDDGPFQATDAFQGPDHDAAAQRLAMIEINGQISNGLLRFTFSYSRERYKKSSIQSWADGFMSELKVILKHCKDPQERAKTASDFKMSGLDNKKLDKVLGQLGKSKKGRRR